MTKLRDEAKTYEPPKTKNITELEVVSLDMDVKDGEGEDGEGKKFFYKYLLYNGEEYRVPGSVLTNIKEIMEVKPNLKTIKVTKKGEGRQTKYTVIELE